MTLTPMALQGLLITSSRPGLGGVTQSSAVTYETVGSAQLQFSSLSNGDSHGDEGKLVYTLNGVTKTKTLRRFNP